MNIHPSTGHEIARMHSNEKLARSLAAHAALQALNGQGAKLDAVQGSSRRPWFVSRLWWRGAGARRSSRPAI